MPTLLQERMSAPVHHGPLDDATVVASLGNPACGDVLTLHLRLVGDTVAAASFESLGSPYQLATASVLCDCIVGGTLESARARSPTCVLEKLPDLPRNARYLARLAVDVLHKALDEGEGKDVSEPCGDGRRRMGRGEAEAWLRGLLQDGAALPASAIDDEAVKQGVCLPGSTLQFLSVLRREGTAASDADATTKQWLWRLADA